MEQPRIQDVNSLPDQIEQLVSYSKSILGDLSDYESNMIRTSMQLVQLDPPSTKLAITERINTLNRSKSDLQYLILKSQEIRRSYNIPYTNEYNKQFTVLTRMNRPSKQAIESEMHFQSAELRDARDKIADIDTLIEFLRSYLGYLDAAIRVLESRKFDV